MCLLFADGQGYVYVTSIFCLSTYIGAVADTLEDSCSFSPRDFGLRTLLIKNHTSIFQATCPTNSILHVLFEWLQT